MARVIYAMGGFREDRRMQMGRSASAHSAQRVTLLLGELIEQTTQLERWGRSSCIPQQDCEDVACEETLALNRWCSIRSDMSPDDPRQSRTVLV